MTHARRDASRRRRVALQFHVIRPIRHRFVARDIRASLLLDAWYFACLS
jgi:hypothetical protein